MSLNCHNCRTKRSNPNFPLCEACTKVTKGQVVTNNNTYDDLEKKYSHLMNPFNGSSALELRDALHMGWFPIVSHFLEILSKMNRYGEGEGAKISHMKDKWGCLSVQLYPSTDATHAAREKVEILSMTTCAKCGGKGSVQEVRGWYTVACHNCAK